MHIPDGQLENVQNLAGRLLEACSDGDEPELPELSRAFGRLTDVMSRVAADGDRTTTDDVTETGEYALRLCEELTACAQRLGTDAARRQAAALTVNVALWIACHEGRIDALEPVVDALALLANTTREPPRLEALGAVYAAVVGAVSPVIRRDIEKVNPGRPWRVMLLNRSIVATRSHNTDLMEQAFTELSRHLPEDAGHFFTEGMQQMDALDYPEHVRRLMACYHRQWTLDRSLH
jgi:hypothetical protein